MTRNHENKPKRTGNRPAKGSCALCPVFGRCGGCQLEANTSDMNRYRAAAADEVLRCEECGRILVRTAESGL